jgi:DNA-binding NtrC family response regulator
MTDSFEFISPCDKPALLGLSTMEWLVKCRTDLTDLGYKVHVAVNHEDFLNRFNRAQYQVVVLERLFASPTQEDNQSLGSLQRLSAAQRRHSVIVLLGDGLQSLNPFQAFQFSVHAVINRSELDSFKPIVQQIVAENDLFLQVFRDAMQQISAWGK